ncbi:MAG: 16S rRNA (uracil(1498)-N(3))-methyltransferase [Halioglobus sp.]
MNLLLFTDSDRTDVNTLRITDRRLQHLLQVHKARVGDSVRVGEIQGKMGLGEIQELTLSQATITVSLDEPPPAKVPIQLIVALPRPKMLRRILRTVAELGVPELHLINSYRVEKSYWQSPVLQPASIRDYLLQGLEQSRDTMLPDVQCHTRFKPFIEDIFPSLAAHKDALLAHPGDHDPVPYGPATDTLLVIGPEGGFIPYEVEKFQQAGCKTLSLGPRILRVENAINYLLGKLI